MPNSATINDKARDIAAYQRILRGFIRPGDELLTFSTLTAGMTQAELEIFWEKIGKALSNG